MAFCAGTRLNGIGFGTWSWGNQLVWGYRPERDDAQLQATFRQALASGLNLIDTADSYGTGALTGRSESLLGMFIAALPASRRHQLVVATKLAPFPWRLGRRGLDQAFAASGQRLQGHLHRVQLHWSTARYAPWQEAALLDGLADRVLAGDVPELGVSNVGPCRLQWMHHHLNERGIQLRSVQVQFSLLSAPSLRDATLLAFCRRAGIEVLAYSPLAFGILCQPPGARPRANTVLRRRLEARLLPASEALRGALQGIALERGVSMTQVALNWCRAHGTTPIPGLRRPSQARDVAAALTWQLTGDEVNLLDGLRRSCARHMPENPFLSD
ncbi:MAG: aldo/keto reductase [Synechococcus sp.]